MKVLCALRLALGMACFLILPARAGASVPLSPDIASVVAGNTDFACAIFSQLATNSGNVFFSPYSMSTALAMTYAGASGETAQQMAQALDFDTNQAQLGADFHALRQQLNKLQGKNGIEFSSANGLWAQQGRKFLPSYVIGVNTDYGAAVKKINFGAKHDLAAKEINAWVSAKTDGTIKNLFTSLPASTRLVLVNAIFFKGTWANTFNTGNTIVQPFDVSSNQTVSAPLMNQTESCSYFANDSLQAVDLAYRGNNLSMTILLPRDRSGLPALEASLTPQLLAQIIGGMSNAQLNIFLPKFQFEMAVTLNPYLENLGITNAFVPALADFSGMDGKTDLMIDLVVHKAFVKVDEGGTRIAGAATGVGITGFSISVPPPVFRADHPFIFLIRDTSSGTILFLGRITDPTATGAS